LIPLLKSKENIHMTVYRRLTSYLVLCCANIPLWAQPKAPRADLVLLENIPVPNWTTSGSTQANFDLFAFNPRTRIMYVADRTNKSITAIDASINQVIGLVTLPSLGSTNGVVVAPELQSLVATDGQSNVFVYDLRLPAKAPDQYVIPNITGGTDALDYDPLNRTVYVINGNAPYYMTGIDLVNHKVASQLLLPGSPELMRFNPADGQIYQVITDNDNKNAGAGVYVFDPVANAITAKYLTSDCVPHGIDIDPVTDVAVLGCGTNQAQVAMDLTSGQIIKRFPDVTGTDLLQFNPSTRRFYTASSGNVSTTTGCPSDSTKSTPVIGVFSSPGLGRAKEDGVECAGRTSHGLGVDPIDDFVYVGTRQFPVNRLDPTSGKPGVLVFYDPTSRSNVSLPSIADLTSNSAFGTVQFTRDHGIVRSKANVGFSTGTAALVNVPTTSGNEVVPCGAVQNGTATCKGPLTGTPLIGATVTLAVDGSPAARGTIYQDKLRN
jgi:hypothetical protein